MIGTVVNPLDRRPVAHELIPMLPPGTELVAFPSQVPAFPHTPVEQAMQQLGHLHAALRAADAGCDAVVIDSVGDYGLPAMRAALGIPAIGSGEAGMAEAAKDGRSFAIVTVWPASMNFIVEGLLHSYGYTSQCLQIINVGGEGDLDTLAGPDGYLSQIRGSDASILDRVDAAIAAAVTGGAQAILLGCTCMSGLAADVASRVAVPVINPLAGGVAAALSAAPLTDIPQLRAGRRDLIDAMVGAVADHPPEDCPVCIISHSLEESTS